MPYQPYTPKRPIKSFLDLEVYQLALGAGVEIFKKIEEDQEVDNKEQITNNRQLTTNNKRQRTDNKDALPRLPDIESKSPAEMTYLIQESKKTMVGTLIDCVLGLPKQIAQAHSLRFSKLASALTILEEAMLSCNRIIVYLELYRDLANRKIEVEFFEELTKNYTRLRFKIMHLCRSWEKFSKQQTIDNR